MTDFWFNHFNVFAGKSATQFGRAVAENGNRGTDHGHGNAILIVGGQRLRGGKVYGRGPGLAREQRYEGRDLAVTTDVRSVFADRSRSSRRLGCANDLSGIRQYAEAGHQRNWVIGGNCSVHKPSYRASLQ